MKDKEFEAKLLKAIFGAKLWKATFGDIKPKPCDCDTCELQYDCEDINGLNPDGSHNVNGCLVWNRHTGE